MTKQGMTLIAEAGEFGLEDIEFEHDYREFETNRMYPPPQRKESVMIRLTEVHISALNHAIQFMEPSVKRFPDDRLRKAVAKDVLRLGHILEHVKATVYAPALPYRKAE